MAGDTGFNISKDLISERVLTGMLKELDSIFNEFVNDRVVNTQLVLEFLCVDLRRTMMWVHSTRSDFGNSLTEKGMELRKEPHKIDYTENENDGLNLTGVRQNTPVSIDTTTIVGVEQRSPTSTAHTVAVDYDEELGAIASSLKSSEITTARTVSSVYRGSLLRAKARKASAPKGCASLMLHSIETMSTKQLTLRYLVMLCVTFGSHILSPLSPHFAKFADSVPVALIASVFAEGIQNIMSAIESVLCNRVSQFRPYSTSSPLPHSIYLPIYVIYTWIEVLRNSDDDDTSHSA